MDHVNRNWFFLIWTAAFKYIKTERNRHVFNYTAVFIAVLYRITTTLFIGDPMITSLFPLAHADAYAIGSIFALCESRQYYDRKRRAVISSAFVISGIILVTLSVLKTSDIFSVSIGEAYKLYISSKNYLNNTLTCNIYLFIDIFAIGLFMLFREKIELKNHFLRNYSKLGNITYEGYLIHFPILVFLSYFLSNSFVLCIVALILAVGTSYIVNTMIKIIKEKFTISSGG